MKRAPGSFETSVLLTIQPGQSYQKTEYICVCNIYNPPVSWYMQSTSFVGRILCEIANPQVPGNLELIDSGHKHRHVTGTLQALGFSLNFMIKRKCTY